MDSDAGGAADAHADGSLIESGLRGKADRFVVSSGCKSDAEGRGRAITTDRNHTRKGGAICGTALSIALRADLI